MFLNNGLNMKLEWEMFVVFFLFLKVWWWKILILTMDKKPGDIIYLLRFCLILRMNCILSKRDMQNYKMKNLLWRQLKARIIWYSPACLGFILWDKIADIFFKGQNFAKAMQAHVCLFVFCNSGPFVGPK